MAPRLENKIFWPVLVSIAVILIARNWSRLTFPPQFICLLAYLGFAGMSSFWAFKPDLSMQRFILQAMLLTCVVFPAMLAAPTADTIRGLFICFGVACLLNIPFVATQEPIYLEGIDVGYAGYFSFKGILGQCAAIAFLLALYEMLHSGRRRVMGVIVIAVATALLILSKSKGSLALAIIAPILASAALHVSKRLHVSLVVILLPIPITYWVFTKLVGNLISRISWHLYGNYTLSGRTYIWDFANSQIAQKPLFGWGYQSFWLEGTDAPSVVNAWGWIKRLPNAHSGYMDRTMLEMGYIGFFLLIAFLLGSRTDWSGLTKRPASRMVPADARALRHTCEYSRKRMDAWHGYAVADVPHSSLPRRLDIGRCPRTIVSHSQ